MSLGSRVTLSLLAAMVFTLSVVAFRPLPDPLFEGRFASAWVNDLLSPDYKIRSEAQAALLSLGESAVPRLRLLLRRQNAVWTRGLVKLNAWAPFLNYKPCDPVLCRQRGAEMAALLGPKAAPALPELIETLSIDSCALDAERALLRCGRVSLPKLEKVLAHHNADVRRRTAKLLHDFDPLPSSSITALIAAAKDGQAGVRRQVAHALGDANSALHDEKVSAALLCLAKDDAAEVRAAAIEALGKRPEDLQTFAAIGHALSDSAVIVRLESAKAIWLLRKDTATILPVLTRILLTREGWQAAYTLAQMGDAAVPAIPELIEALRREQVPRPYRTPPSSAFALGQIGSAAIPALHALLTAAEPRSRINAVLAIGFMGKRGSEAVPELLPLLQDRDAEVRHATALTLATIGAQKEQVLPGLTACLNADDIYMRSAAAQSLREIAPEGNWVVNPE